MSVCVCVSVYLCWEMNMQQLQEKKKKKQQQKYQRTASMASECLCILLFEISESQMIAIYRRCSVDLQIDWNDALNSI